MDLPKRVPPTIASMGRRKRAAVRRGKPQTPSGTLHQKKLRRRVSNLNPASSKLKPHLDWSERVYGQHRGL